MSEARGNVASPDGLFPASRSPVVPTVVTRAGPAGPSSIEVVNIMRRHTRRCVTAPVAAVAASLLGLGGCGGTDGLPRQAVSGTVTVDGKPLKAGLITFMPSGPDIPTQGGATVL